MSSEFSSRHGSGAQVIEGGSSPDGTYFRSNDHVLKLVTIIFENGREVAQEEAPRAFVPSRKPKSGI
jgi:hypothetical protein